MVALPSIAKLILVVVLVGWRLLFQKFYSPGSPLLDSLGPCLLENEGEKV